MLYIVPQSLLRWTGELLIGYFDSSLAVSIREGGIKFEYQTPGAAASTALSRRGAIAL